MTHKVRLLPSGHEFTVESGETVLEAALRHGLNLPYSCRNAVCGTCKAKIVSGAVTYGTVLPVALSAAEETAGLVLLCRAQPLSHLIVETVEATDEGMVRVKRLPARVDKKERLTPDVMRVYLRLPAAQRMQFLAGQYIDFVLPDGRHRSFSLANAPHEDRLLELHIRHVEQGEFTAHIFEYMHEKDMVRIEGPHGQFYLREDSPRPLIFMAGGTGFAPIKGIIEHAHAAAITRPMHLYWGARAQVDLYLSALPLRWASEHPQFRYTPVLSRPAPADAWPGRQGYVHEALAFDYTDLKGYDLYAAGPPAMIRALRDIALARGLESDHFYSDPFEFAADVLAKQAKA